MLNQRLSQKLLQKLSPQQIQLMKLLQVPTSMLEQRIKEELEINPALDENPTDFDGDKEDLAEPQEIREEEENFESSETDDFMDSMDVNDYAKESEHDYNDDDFGGSNSEEKNNCLLQLENHFMIF